MTIQSGADPRDADALLASANEAFTRMVSVLTGKPPTTSDPRDLQKEALVAVGIAHMNAQGYRGANAEIARLRNALTQSVERTRELLAQLAAAQADNAALRGALEQCESPGQPVPGENWWWCKIGPAIPGDPINDNVMRTAVEGAFQQLTGRPSGACFSGWGASLTEGERDAFEDREFRPQGESHDPKWKALATPAPGAPLLDAVRGLAVLADKHMWKLSGWATRGTGHRVCIDYGGEYPQHQTYPGSITACELATALAAIRALLPKAP